MVFRLVKGFAEERNQSPLCFLPAWSVVALVGKTSAMKTAWLVPIFRKPWNNQRRPRGVQRLSFVVWSSVLGSDFVCSTLSVPNQQRLLPSLLALGCLASQPIYRPIDPQTNQPADEFASNSIRLPLRLVLWSFSLSARLGGYFCTSFMITLLVHGRVLEVMAQNTETKGSRETYSSP